MKALYLIDSENVGDFWIPLLDLPDEDTELVVFYTKNSPHMSYESLIKLKLSDKEVTFIKCYEGTNALDFQLVSELGYRMRGNEEGEFIIVTNDTGYDAAVKYWRKKGFSVRRITGKECKNAAKSRRRTDRGPAERRVPQNRKADETAQPVTEPAAEEPALQEQEAAVPIPVEEEPTAAAETDLSTDSEEEVSVSESGPGVSKEAEPEDSEEQTSVSEPEETVFNPEVSEETVSEPEVSEEETNRSPQVVEKKIWNGSGFSTVIVGAPTPAQEEKEAASSEPQPETSESETSKSESGYSGPEPDSSVTEEAEDPEKVSAEKNSADEMPAAEEAPSEVPAEEVPAAEETPSEVPEEEITVKEKSSPEEVPAEEAAPKKPEPKAKAVATVRPSKAKRSEKKKPEKAESEKPAKTEKPANSAEDIVIDKSGVSSGEAELKDLTVIVSCVGMDNLAELHNQLIQFYGEGGKQIYQSIKNGSLEIQTADWNQHEKYAQYGELIFRHHGEGEKCPDDFADFIESAGRKRDNLNSFRYALLKRYGKEKGRRYYFLLKPFMKAINEM